MKIKKHLALSLPLFFLIFTFCNAPTKKTAESTGQNSQTALKTDSGPASFTVISVYSHWVTSMCAQGCENYDFGLYQLHEPPESIPAYTVGKIAMATGSLKQVEEYPTIAGPRASNDYLGKKVKVERFFPESMQLVNFATLSQTDHSIKVKINNPLQKPLNLKVTLDETIKKVAVKAGSSAMVDFEAPESYYQSVIIASSDYDKDNREQSLAKLQQQGVVVWVKMQAR